MTQEEKAKAYDEAIEKLREFYRDYDTFSCLIDVKEELANLFPELAESEDERIIKRIIHALHGDVLDMEETTKAVAWLEKQHIDPYNGVCFDCYGHHWGMCARDNGIEIVMDGKPVRHFSYKDCEQTFGSKTALESINEVKVDNQNCVKPVDKIKPKVHHYNLWTLADAKDSDVLVTANGRPFIYKGCLDPKHPNSPVAYCGIDTEGYLCRGRYNHWWTDEKVQPATKEQRDLLFQKINEEGYEWDAEKKELKNMKVTSSTYCSENCKGYQETGKCFADGECDSKRKYDNMLDSCEIEHIEHGKYYYCIKDYYAGGNKRASKGDIVPAKRGMSMMTLGAKANEYFLPVNNINVIERLESTNETL